MSYRLFRCWSCMCVMLKETIHRNCLRSIFYDCVTCRQIFMHFIHSVTWSSPNVNFPLRVFFIICIVIFCLVYHFVVNFNLWAENMVIVLSNRTDLCKTYWSWLKLLNMHEGSAVKCFMMQHSFIHSFIFHLFINRYNLRMWK